MIKFKFELILQDGVVKPYIEPYGYIFRALLMTWFKEIAPRLVHDLHSFNKIRPYSISVSYYKDKLVFYLNCFNPELSNPIINDLLINKEKKFNISDQIFILKKVLFEDYPLINLTKLARNVKRFKIEFLEPTYFNMSRSNNVIRLPIPELIFNNLTNLWNELYEGKEKIEEDTFLQWINQNLFPSSLKIKTKSKEMGEKVPAVGFVGWVNFEINENNSYYTHQIDTLCRFGELTNIGGNRTMGLGVIKYTPLEYFNNDKSNNFK